MTDMTAEQALELLADMAHMEAEEYARAGGGSRVESLQAIIRQALSAPRVPEALDADKLHAEKEALDPHARTPYMHTLRWVQGWNACREAMLTAAPAPADVTLTNEGDIGQVPDSDELAEPAPSDNRPRDCRNRMRDEGKPYPRSGCSSCGNGGLMGCPHERTALAEPAQDEPVSQTADIFDAYKSWPDDIRKKLSVHDLRRMNGWIPQGERLELAKLRESYRVQLSDYSAAVAARDAELAKLRERVKVLEGGVDDHYRAGATDLANAIKSALDTGALQIGLDISTMLAGYKARLREGGDQ